MTAQLKRRPSGNTAAQRVREKYDSISEGTLPLVRDLRAKIVTAIDSVRRNTPRPDPRREEGDSRADAGPPTDVVELPSSPPAPAKGG